MNLVDAWPAALLYAMATLDSGLVGFRVAAGRRLAIHKRGYYLRAMRQSFLLGQLVLAISASIAVLALSTVADTTAAWRLFLLAARNLLFAYAPYSLLVLLALAVYLIPKDDSRAIATVVILGPFTLLRPYVFLLGLGICWWQTRALLPCLIASFGVALQLALEPALERRRRQTTTSRRARGSTPRGLEG
ncbi:MAG: hypothetical protein KC766_22965 [Myxococcales bacterium]|nr:hypothetical protein [Myxococcales bacterium]